MLCHLLVVLIGVLSLVFLFLYVKVVLLFLITDILVAGSKPFTTIFNLLSFLIHKQIELGSRLLADF